MKFKELYELFHGTGCPGKPIITDAQLKEFIMECNEVSDWVSNNPEKVIPFQPYSFFSNYVVMGLRMDAEAAKRMLEARKEK